MPEIIPPDLSVDIDDTVIENNGFFSDLSVNDFKSKFRVTIADVDVICQNLESAMYEKNTELNAWVCKQQRAGYPTLDATLLQHPEYKHYYLTAVFAYAKGLMLQQYRDFDTSKSGHGRADDLTLSAGDYFHQSEKNINLLISKPNITVELL